MPTHVRRIEDEDDRLGLGYAVVVVEIDYEIVDGDRGCRRDANGDGWPPEPDTVGILGWRVVSVTVGGAAVPWCFDAELHASVNAFAGEAIDCDHAEIEVAILEAMEASRDA